jgi:hypothetical protein
VLARIAAHVQNARQMRQARSPRRLRPGHRRGARRRQPHRLADPLARSLLNAYFANPEHVAPEELLAWIAAAHAARSDGRDPPALLVADGPGACSPPSTTRPATTNGWWCCARRTTPPPSNP